MSEQCVFCGHKHLISKTTRYIYQKDEQMLVVEHVPCLECTFCGEQYFDAVVLQKIENDYPSYHSSAKATPASYAGRSRGFRVTFLMNDTAGELNGSTATANQDIGAIGLNAIHNL